MQKVTLDKNDQLRLVASDEIPEGHRLATLTNAQLDRVEKATGPLFLVGSELKTRKEYMESRVEVMEAVERQRLISGDVQRPLKSTLSRVLRSAPIDLQAEFLTLLAPGLVVDSKRICLFLLKGVVVGDKSSEWVAIATTLKSILERGE